MPGRKKYEKRLLVYTIRQDDSLYLNVIARFAKTISFTSKLLVTIKPKVTVQVIN